MTHPILQAAPRVRNLGALVLRQVRGFRLSLARQEGWRSWFFEICILIAVILALSVVLQPRIMLMNASPHPFWLPVVAASLVHGTLPGLVAAVLAGLCAWLFGGMTVTTEDDFYDLMFRAFKEPVLWMFSALVLGTFRDRIEDERQRLARERDEARDDLGNVVDHATTLRERINELERSLVLADLGTHEDRLVSNGDPVPLEPAVEIRLEVPLFPTVIAPEPADVNRPRLVAVPASDPSAVLVSAAPRSPRVTLVTSEPEPAPLRTDPLPDARPRFAWDWASLWEATEHGWRLRARHGQADVPDAGRLLRHFDQHRRVFDCRIAEDRQVLPDGALLASPFRRGLEPASRVILVGGGHLDADVALGDILPAVLRLADQLDAAAGREDI